MSSWRNRTMGDTGHRVVIDGPGKHSLQEMDPPAVVHDEVLVKVAYVGICATDLEVANGELDYYRRGTARYPIVPGHEYSGTVARAGDGVTGLKPGDSVVGECAIGCGLCEWCRVGDYYRCATRREVGVINKDGAYATFLTLPANYVHRLPDSMSLKHAALIEPTAVCVKAVRKLSPVPGRGACVIGAGPIGNICAQVLRHKGIEVAVVDQDPARLGLARRHNIEGRSDVDGMGDFDYLVECSGNESIIPRMIEDSKPSAKIVLVGLPYTRPVSVSFSSVTSYDKEIYGSVASHRRDWEEAIGLVGGGMIDLEDHTSTIMPLERYNAAWQRHSRREQLKVLLEISPDRPSP